MKKLLLILLIIGVLIMLRPINAIIKDNVGNIIYRGFVVTGEVVTDNGDGSYDVYIAGETKAYPKVFTLSRNPDLEVGDTVRILYKNGCKELPIILPPVKPTALNYIFVVYKSGSNYYLNKYSTDGALVGELGILTEISGSNSVVRMCVDSNQNIYILEEKENPYPQPFEHKIYKYDKDGSHLLTKPLTENEMVAYISPDGYLYTKIWTNDFVTKRNLSNLNSVSTHTIISGHRYRYLSFDSDGYLYTYDENYAEGSAFLKWKLGVGEVTHFTKSLTGLSAWSTWAVAGDYMAGHEVNLNYQIAFTMPKSFSTDLTTWTLDGIKYSYDVASISNYFIFLGKSAANKLVMEKYDTSRIKQWSIEIANYTLTHAACGVAAYPF